jgi:hypothetical protein
VQVASSDTDLLDHFEVVVDPTAEPVDFDDVLADFLLHVAEKRRAARAPGPCRLANMEERSDGRG